MSNTLYRGGFFGYFNRMNDPRQKGKVWHRLTDILFIVVSGVICGYDEWDVLHEWASASASQKWLKEHIALANGMPSLSTIKRVFGILDPKEFSARFVEWMNESLQLPDKDVISLDGKTSRGSKDINEDQKALHIVSALCHSHGLVIGQATTDEKSNEITAIPALLDQLFIEGCIVTIDAMGLQKRIVKKIVNENKADYVINLKGNQGTLQQEVKGYFEELEQTRELENIKQQAKQEKALKFREHSSIQVHSTIEKKRTWTHRKTDLFLF